MQENERLKDNVRIKVAITDKTTFKKVENVVGKSIPILKIEYIKETLLYVSIFVYIIWNTLYKVINKLHPLKKVM